MSDRAREKGGAGTGGEGGEVRQPSPFLLVGTLGVLAVLAGLAIVVVYEWANPRIQEHQARELEEAIREVLGGPERYETRWVRDGSLLDSLPSGTDSASAVPVYAGYDDGGALVGYAIAGEKAGYQDIVGLIFGYDPASEQVVGMKVLESKETPGLGSKIITDSTFLDEFAGVETPLVGVKEGGDGPGEVDMITGATISSEVVIEIINERLDQVGPALGAPAESTAMTGEGIVGGGRAP